MKKTSVPLEIGAAYIRVSTDDQTELSPDAQLREILKAAKTDGFVIPKEFIFIEKRGISGRRAENRPEFQKMIATAKSQKPAPFSRLYLWKFSRFARNQEESTFYKGILRKKCNVDIKSVSEPIMEGMFGRLIEMIIEWFDEYYSINLSGEVTRGMTEKALRNGYQTTPCLGYAAVGEGKPFVIVEPEYRIVEFIHSSYHQGKDMTAIAREANRLGYLTKRGNRFDRRAVALILQNPFYAGIVSWNGIQFQGEHETRSSVTDLFQENQERIRKEYRPLKRREVSSCSHWASGLLRCSICGSSLSFNRTGSNGKRSDFFQCWKYSKGIHPGSCSISVRQVEKAIISSLEEILASGDICCEYLPPHQESPQSDELDRIRDALSRLETKERRIHDAYEGGVDTLEEYRRNKERLQAERISLEQQAADLAASAPAPPAPPSKEEILSAVEDTYRLLSDPEISYEIKGAAARRIIKEIVYNRSENTFHFTYYIS